MDTRVVVLDPSGFSPPYDRRLCRGLTDHVDSVELVTCHGFPYPDDATGFDVTELFYPIYANYDLPKPMKGLEHAKDLLRLVAHLQRLDPDIVHVQWPTLPVFDRWLFAFLRRNYTTVLTVHNTTPFHGSTASIAQLIQYEQSVEAFDGWIVHTDYSRREFLSEHDIPNERVTVVPHGIISYPAVPEPLNREPFELLYFGTIKRYKGMDTLIKSLDSLPSEVCDRFRVRIIGSAQSPVEPYKELARSLGVSDLVEWDLRFVPDNEIPTLFHNADGLVLPYRDIDQSGVLMTAIDYPLPIIASDIGGFGELLTDGENALLFDPDSPTELANRIESLLTDESLRRRLTDGVEAFAELTPTWSEIAAETVSFYRSLD